MTPLEPIFDGSQKSDAEAFWPFLDGPEPKKRPSRSSAGFLGHFWRDRAPLNPTNVWCEHGGWSWVTFATFSQVPGPGNELGSGSRVENCAVKALANLRAENGSKLPLLIWFWCFGDLKRSL